MPGVAGVAALYLDLHPEAGTKEVRTELRAEASVGKINGLGPRSPDKLLYSLVS